MGGLQQDDTSEASPEETLIAPPRAMILALLLESAPHGRCLPHPLRCHIILGVRAEEAMKRRFKAGREAHHHGAGPFGVEARRAATSPSPIPRPFSTDELTRLTRGRDEALEQQAASEVLKVISRSPSDPSAHIATMLLVEAVRICEANLRNIYRSG